MKTDWVLSLKVWGFLYVTVSTPKQRQSDVIYMFLVYNSGLKLNSRRATALQSLAPNHTCLEVSSDPEDLDYLDQVCLIRVGAKLCKAVAL